jgi:glycosyltransferase involved in cell wall biosynthesis
LLEAMSVGCACVATSVDGTIDVAKDGTNMLLVRPNDPLSLAVGLATVVEKSTLRSNLSQNAKTTAAEFSGEKMIQGFEEAYRHVYPVS